MTDKEKFISIIKQSLKGSLTCNMVDKLAHKIADGLVLNGMKFEEVD